MPHILLISRDSNLISTMQVACAKSSVDLVHCFDTASAAALLERRKFYAVLVDDTDPGSTSEFLKAVRQGRSSAKATSIVFAGSPTTASEAALVVSKPVSLDLALRVLRAAQGPMSLELRRYARRPTKVPVTLTTSSKQDIKAVLMNVSEGGLSIQFAKEDRLPVTSTVAARFVVPTTGEWVQLNGEVVWCDAEGRAGLRCSGLTNVDRDRVRKWLEQQDALAIVSHPVRGPSPA